MIILPRTYATVPIFVHEKSYHMAADKSGTTGDQDVAFE